MTKKRPFRILYDKTKRKYYVNDHGKKKYFKNLDEANKIKKQNELNQKPKQSININKPISLEERVKNLGFRFVSASKTPASPPEYRDEGLIEIKRQEREALKESPEDFKAQLDQKILNDQPLDEYEQSTYPIITEQIKEIEQEPVIQIPEQKEQKKVKKRTKQSQKALQKLFQGNVPDLGPKPDKTKPRISQSYLNPYEYIKNFLAKNINDDAEQIYKILPLEYWIGPNTLISDLYPLITFIKAVNSMNEDRVDTIFADWPIETKIEDPAKRLRQKKHKIYAQAIPSNVFKIKEDGLITGIKFNRKPLAQYGSGSKLPALYSDEIEEFFEDPKDYPQFGGVISADEIRKLPKKIPIGFIMNLDKRNQPGSHWVAVYISNDSIEYFDPFGKDPTDQFKKDITNFVNSMHLPIMMKFKINKVQRQHGNSFKCGYHSIRFLDDRFRGIPFYKASGYDSVQSGENIKDTFSDWERGEKNIKNEFEYI